MITPEKLRDRFALKFDRDTYRRTIAGHEVILHCHHYNSRIQNTVESAAEVDGRSIVVSAAESVFRGHVAAALTRDDERPARWAVAAGLYAHLGYGRLDFAEIEKDRVTASASHFVEGWNAGFPGRKTPCCSVTEGYIAGAIAAVTGESVHVRETACMVTGAPRCVFEIDRARKEPIVAEAKRPFPLTQKRLPDRIASKSVDEARIIAALTEMPIHGNEQGLIPAFSVYLASTPADFYNQLCIRFVESMAKAGLFDVARRLLISDAETCGMNTFRGIMSSAEWDGLIQPMIREKSDNLFGVIAISNALGWGNWHVTRHEPARSLTMESLNGYEALGFREIRGRASDPQCFMLTGVAAGIMELIYGEGDLDERFGTYASTEEECICCDAASCRFAVERA